MKTINFHNKYWDHLQLASKQYKEKTVVNINEIEMGEKYPVIIAGPCSVENEDIMRNIAEIIKKNGGHILRGGVFKSRTSPRASQLNREKLKMFKKVGEEFGLPIVTEVTSTSQVKFVEKYVDILQIGARNMQNFALLKEVSRTKKPVLLKRGFFATIEEWLLAAEAVMMEGNENVILCERGIRTFEPLTRNTLDISAVPLVKEISHLPIIVDPSHASGRRNLIIPLARAGIAAGADGIMVEVHPEPDKAISDGFQSLSLNDFPLLMNQINMIK